VRKLPGNSFLALQNTFIYNRKPPSIFVTVDSSLSSPTITTSGEYWKIEMGKGIVFTVAMVVICLSGKGVAGQEHHVVGADRGWDPTSDLVSWSSGRVFRVGDQICKSHSFSLFLYQIGKSIILLCFFYFILYLPYPLSFTTFLIGMKMKNDETCPVLILFFTFHYTIWVLELIVMTLML